jgi:hypothetical protein
MLIGLEKGPDRKGAITTMPLSSASFYENGINELVIVRDACGKDTHQGDGNFYHILLILFNMRCWWVKTPQQGGRGLPEHYFISSLKVFIT